MKVICIKDKDSNGYLKQGSIYDAYPSNGYYRLKGVPSEWYRHRFVKADFNNYIKLL